MSMTIPLSPSEVLKQKLAARPRSTKAPPVKTEFYFDLDPAKGFIAVKNGGYSDSSKPGRYRFGSSAERNAAAMEIMAMSHGVAA